MDIEGEDDSRSNEAKERRFLIDSDNRERREYLRRSLACQQKVF